MTERQEVARRLRALDCKIRSTDTLESACTNLMQATYGIDHPFSPIEFSVRNLCGLASVLADLIDYPTCEYLPCAYAIWYDDDGEEHEDTKLEALGTSEDTYCSVCGYEMVAGDDGWFDYERKEHGSRLIPLFDYCPNCGSKVVVSQDE